jgi:hypothetical protein
LDETIHRTRVIDEATLSHSAVLGEKNSQEETSPVVQVVLLFDVLVVVVAWTVRKHLYTPTVVLVLVHYGTTIEPAPIFDLKYYIVTKMRRPTQKSSMQQGVYTAIH